MPIFSKTISPNSKELGFKVIGKSHSHRRVEDRTFLISHTYSNFSSWKKTESWVSTLVP